MPRVTKLLMGLGNKANMKDKLNMNDLNEKCRNKSNHNFNAMFDC